MWQIDRVNNVTCSNKNSYRIWTSATTQAFQGKVIYDSALELKMGILIETAHGSTHCT